MGKVDPMDFSKKYFLGRAKAYVSGKGNMYIPLGDYGMAMGYAIDPDCVKELESLKLGAEFLDRGRRCIDFGLVGLILSPVDMVDWVDGDGQVVKRPIFAIHHAYRIGSLETNPIMLGYFDGMDCQLRRRCLDQACGERNAGENNSGGVVVHVLPERRMHRVRGEGNGGDNDFISCRATLLIDGEPRMTRIALPVQEWDAISDYGLLDDDIVLYARSFEWIKDGCFDRRDEYHPKVRFVGLRFLFARRGCGEIPLAKSIRLPKANMLFKEDGFPRCLRKIVLSVRRMREQDISPDREGVDEIIMDAMLHTHLSQAARSWLGSLVMEGVRTDCGKVVGPDQSLARRMEAENVGRAIPTASVDAIIKGLVNG